MLHPREQSLSDTTLTVNERAGGVCPSYFSRRSHQVPSNWPSPVSRFLAQPAKASSNTVPSNLKPTSTHHVLPRRTSGGGTVAA